VKMSLNPFDEIAVEEALRQKEKGVATEVIVVSVGVKQCQDQLRVALAMGADRAILVDTEAVDPQPLGIAKVLRQIVEQEQPGMVILGKQAIDGDNNQTGQMLAGLLSWPQAVYASKVVVASDKKSAEVTREVDGGSETISVSLPAIVTADLRLNEPRYATLPNIMKAKKKELVVKTPKELGVDITPTQKILQVVEPPTRKAGGTVPDVDTLLQKLRGQGLIK